MRSVSPPRVETSSSWTNLMTCWLGDSDFDRSAPTMRARTRSTKPRATVRLTSASRRATRISRRTSSTSASLSRPLPRRRLKMPSKRSERASNMRSTRLQLAGVTEVATLPPTEWLAGVAAAHRRLLDLVRALDDDLARRPRALPDWTVGLVLTHLARNADGNRGLVAAAARDEVGDLYPGGRSQRDTAIEAGAGRSHAELVVDLVDAVTALEVAWSSVPEAAGGRTGRGTAGHELTMAEWVFRRWREVEMHLVDLGSGWYRPSDWPPAYVDEELRRMVAGFGAKDELLAWLARRGPAPEPPTWP